MRELTRAGWSRDDRRAALRSGRLVRVRTGWLARVDADQEAVRAVASGGCVACGSALRLRGAWVPAQLGRGHVRRARRGDRRPDGCRLFGAAPPVTSAVDDVETAFRCLLRCGTHEDVVVVADSLLHRGMATLHELERWCAAAPSRIRALLVRVDAAESGLESMVRLRLRSRRIRVRTQVRIGRFRVDLLVGDRLVIECDGAEHHADWRAHAADRERDRELTAAGYLVVRLTYGQIVDDWLAVERDLLTLVRAGAHLASRGTR